MLSEIPLLRAFVIAHVARTLLAETAQVVGELHHVVASHRKVRRVLRVTRARRAREGRAGAVEEVVHAEDDFAALVFEDLLADAETQEILLTI